MVPKPVDETERKDVVTVPVAFVEEAILKSALFVFPYGLKIEKDAVPVVVPTPRFPMKLWAPCATLSDENGTASARPDTIASLLPFSDTLFQPYTPPTARENLHQRLVGVDTQRTTAIGDNQDFVR